MSNEYTAERLMRWGSDCNNGGLGLSLVRYADAWERERDALRAEVERLRQLLLERDGGTHDSDCKIHNPGVGKCTCLHDEAADEATAIAQETGQYDEWLTHDSHEPPVDLAPAQVVELWAEYPAMRHETSEVNWEPGIFYRLALSADGVPLCSAEGLEPWAWYVVTPFSGFPAQCLYKPEYQSDGLWFAPGWSYAPSTHRRPGPASESLMEVCRD